MKCFYLLRHDDRKDNSGTGVVAEGIVFDSGMVAMTWLTKYSTVTIFDNIATVKSLHSHNGDTEVIVEKQDYRFDNCKKRVRAKNSEIKNIKKKKKKKEQK